MANYSKNPFEAYIQGEISQREMIDQLNKRNSSKNLENKIKYHKLYYKPKIIISNKEEIQF